MVSIGGPGAMLLGSALALVLCAVLATALHRRLGALRAWCLAGLLWSVVVIAVVTLLPANGVPGVIPAGEAQTTCSFDLGGPAPDGFWIFGGGQRLLNTALFVPAGFFLAVVLLSNARRWGALVAGLVLLAAYSAGIETVQLALARLDRACDVTDVVDNTTGALLGAAIGAAVGTAIRLAGTRRRSRSGRR